MKALVLLVCAFIYTDEASVPKWRQKRSVKFSNWPIASGKNWFPDDGTSGTGDGSYPGGLPGGDGSYPGGLPGDGGGGWFPGATTPVAILRRFNISSHEHWDIYRNKWDMQFIDILNKKKLLPISFQAFVFDL
ncbi:Hypothetical predicted protein [Mytilus galloprovincialis]|uniref:Uncharacterized protein n=1 Tax=Mytilus galloprovincialis TaxID=29158 RepID=A0A8B6HAJ7_MYTGA|nr:Hypothetical predicted protein [Mytilus galloprovincialis]